MMTEHIRTTFLALVIDALGAPPPQVSRLEATFQAGIGRALKVTVAEVPADDHTLIAYLTDQFWALVHAVGMTPIQITHRAFGCAEQCGYAALCDALAGVGLTSDAWIAVLRGLYDGPSDATRGIACTTALTALWYAARVDGCATPQTRLAACQDAICAIAYLHLVDAGSFRMVHIDRPEATPAWRHLLMHRLRRRRAAPMAVLEAARRAGYPPTLAVLCFTLRVMATPIPPYRTARDVVFVARDHSVVATAVLEPGDQMVAVQDLAAHEVGLALAAYNAQCLQRVLAATHDHELVSDLPRSTQDGRTTRRAA